MKTEKSNTQLVPISDALDGFEKLFSNPVKVDRPGIWAEPQLYLLPFCVPQCSSADKFRSIKITETVRVDDLLKSRSFKVNPDPDLGLPGPFELEVMTGIYRLADEQRCSTGVVPEFLHLGTFRGFLESIGCPGSGKYISMLKLALRRLTCTVCISEGFFYSKPRDLYVVESFTFITSLQMAGETDFKGNKFESTQFRLHEFIRENLNSNFRTLIDFEYLRKLKTSIAKPLALHLIYRIFKNASSSWETDYDWLAGRLGLKVQSNLKRAKEQLKPALVELQETGLIYSWEWIGGRLRFVAGERLVQLHSERVAAKDSWLAHQTQLKKDAQLIPRTEREATRLADYDPLAPICAKYAINGWPAVAYEAKLKSLSEAALRTEAQKRGHSVPLDICDTPTA